MYGFSGSRMKNNYTATLPLRTYVRRPFAQSDQHLSTNLDRSSWGWPDWRDGDLDTLRQQVDHPMTVILDAVSEGYRPSEWRKRPADPEQAMLKAQARLADVPCMVPVYAHRYLPAGRDTSAQPVWSIHSVHDTIVYGLDLADYVDQEFRTAGRQRALLA
jgi:hypothetical protein